MQDQRSDIAAGNNEIDQPLLDLLQQNIAAAKAANQEKPAEFMEKVRRRRLMATSVVVCCRRAEQRSHELHVTYAGP